MLGFVTTASFDLAGLMRRTVRFLWPTSCVHCGTTLTDDPVRLFCRGCWTTIWPLSGARCARCDRPFASPAATSHSPRHVCQSCTQRPPSYTRAWTLYPYMPPLQDAIRLLKYRGKVALAPALAHLIVDALPAIEPVDCIMPVPLHPRRLREREFNQALLLADVVARRWQIPVSCTNLIRVVPSAPQTTLSRTHRLRNLRGAFAVRHPDAVRDQRILLIDDVWTTGATMNECAKTLRKAGSGHVFALTLARTMDASAVPDRLLAARPGIGAFPLGA